MDTKKTIEPNIDLADAEKWCSNWRKTYKQLFPAVTSSEVLRGFYIPIEDINSLADVHNAVAVRAYLAMENEDDPSTLKIVLVPVIVGADGFEKDKIMDDIPVAPTKYYLYDFTRPCPIQCDLSSPLYGPSIRDNAQNIEEG